MTKPYNIMEELVDLYLNEIIENDELIPCKCKECINDIAALALCNLEPKYIRNPTKIAYTECSTLKQQIRANVITAIMKAIETVSKEPHYTNK